jgi:hypothetical protein
MQLVKMRVELYELTHKQGELMVEKSCGVLNIYMDPDDAQAFNESHLNKAVRLVSTDSGIKNQVHKLSPEAMKDCLGMPAYSKNHTIFPKECDL